LVPIASASARIIQFVPQREAQSGKVWFPASGILPNETISAAAAQVLLRETGLTFSSDDVQLVRDEVVSITLADGEKTSRLGFLVV
jgi:hypothetical protein